MRFGLIAVLTCVAFPVFAQQPPANLHLTVTPDEVNFMGQALDLMPYGKAAPLISKLHQQIVDQMQPPAAPPAPPTTASEPSKPAVK